MQSHGNQSHSYSEHYHLLKDMTDRKRGTFPSVSIAVIISLESQSVQSLITSLDLLPFLTKHSLADTPSRIQRNIKQLIHVPGTQLYIGDASSRLQPPKQATEATIPEEKASLWEYLSQTKSFNKLRIRILSQDKLSRRMAQLMPT